MTITPEPATDPQPRTRRVALSLGAVAAIAIGVVVAVQVGTGRNATTSTTVPGPTSSSPTAPQQTDTTTAPPQTKPTTVAAEPVLVVRRSGGLVPMGWDIRQAPDAIVTNDGSVYRPGVTTMQYPGPLLLPIDHGTLSTDERASIDQMATSAGLDRSDVDWGMPPTADVPSLDVVYRGNAVSIPSFGVGEESLSPAQRSARATVAKLLMSLSELPSDGLAKPSALALVAFPVDTSVTLSPDQPVPNVVDWPSELGPLADYDTCGVLDGAAAQQALAVLAKATQITQFRSGTATFTVSARHVVPGDPGC